MGTKISIDKHVSTLEDILEMSPSYFDKIKFESKISQNITQHLKIWKFSEDKRKFDSVKSTPVQLHNLQQSSFYFQSDEAYLILLVYKNGYEAQSDLVSFPHSVWGIVQSAENLTPRGLMNTFSTNADDKFQNHQFDSFLLSKRRDMNEDEEMKDDSKQKMTNQSQQFKYMIFVWNGKQAGPLVKATALTKGYELDDLLIKAKDAVLQVFFSGGVIRGKKLQRSNVLVFDDVIDSKKNDGDLKQQDNPNTPSAEEIVKAYETVYLLKWLFPQRVIEEQIKSSQYKDYLKKPKFQNFLNTFRTAQKQLDYWQKFDNIDKMLQDIDLSSDNEDPPFNNKKQDRDQNNQNEIMNDSDYDEDENMNDISDRNVSEGIISYQNDQEKADASMSNQAQQQKPAEQLKQVLGGGLKQPIPPIGKLNLANVSREKDQDELKKVEPQKQQNIPALGLGGQKGKFSLDVSKAQKMKNQEENGQDSQRELIDQQQQEKEAKEQQQKKTAIPGLKLGGGLDLQANKLTEQQQQQNQGPPKKMGLGLGLDLSKAQSYQQETLIKNEEIIKKAKENQVPTENEGPQLQINISNISKLREIQQEYPMEEAPGHRRGQEEEQEMNIDSQLSKKILSVSSRGDTENSDLSSTNRDLIPPEQLTDEDFDMKGTSRKEYENEYYKRICSEILDGFLYLGSDIVAQDKEILQKNGITHVINCAADYSANYFDGEIKYKKYHLKDHIRENIECVFYDAMHFIQDAKNSNGKVYVHCVQGVSRSATIVLAYLIFAQKMNYQDSYNYLKERRAIANPNMTFIAQLIQFYKRMYQEAYESLPVSPRVFIMMENLYQGKNSKVLDPRGMFIIQGRDQIMIWVGSSIPQANIESYKRCAENYIKLLQKYERAPQQHSYVNQYEEDAAFWKLFNLDSKPQKDYEQIAEWNTIFLDLAKVKHQDKKAPVVTQMQNYREIVSNEQQFKPRLFVYPDSSQSSTVFDLDDLAEDNFLLLCIRAKPEEGLDDELHIWRGPDFNDKDLDVNHFIEEVIKKYWGEDKDPSEIERVEQMPGNEEDDFLNYFD